MDIGKLIQDLGFPIVISLILIFRTETKIDKLSELIGELIKEIRDLSNTIKE
ncbi:MAG: YvrJ family protein [Peptoniphilaceae bacterium]|nr:YvrJ family protein [Peptoniphilaceae bacterium]MDY6018492.1 YvrJ family protein [Anaerococcus sp.]